MELNKEVLNDIFQYQDGKLFWKKITGNRAKIGDIAGRQSGSYRMVGLHKRAFMEHRLIFMMHHGYFPQEVDHIDGNKLNNKIENLRSASHLENLRNQKIRINNVSGHKNVGWASREQKWRVRLTVNRKDKHIGYFDDRELADLVAVEATNKFHKEFSAYKGVLNGKQ
jgi:HNH endonuclease